MSNPNSPRNRLQRALEDLLRKFPGFQIYAFEDSALARALEDGVVCEGLPDEPVNPIDLSDATWLERVSNTISGLDSYTCVTGRTAPAFRASPAVALPVVTGEPCRCSQPKEEELSERNVRDAIEAAALLTAAFRTPPKPKAPMELEHPPYRYEHVAFDLWDIWYQPAKQKRHLFITLSGWEEDAKRVSALLNDSYYTPCYARTDAGGKD